MDDRRSGDLSPRSPIHKREYRGRSVSPKQSQDHNMGTNLFVTGLALRVRESDLDQLFSKYGKVDKIQIMRDPHDDSSRGFGFINFSTDAEAEAALALDGTEVEGKALIVQKAKRSRARTPTPGQYRGPISKDRRGGYEPRGGYERDRYDPRGYNAPPPRYPPFERYESRGGDGGYDRRDVREFDDRRLQYDDRRAQYDDRRPVFDDKRAPPPPQSFERDDRERDRRY